MAGDSQADPRTDRLFLIQQARTQVAMDLWIRNGGQPAEPAKPVRTERYAGGPGIEKRRPSIDEQIDAIVGFHEDGSPVAGGRERDAVPDRGPVRYRGGPAAVVPEHWQPTTLYEWTFYPEHDSREDSSSTEYRKARAALVKDGACLVCNVTLAVLKDPVASKDSDKNPFKAAQLETHHRIIEWALANAIDLDKFNQRIVQRYRARDATNAKYAADFKQPDMLAWIDHDPDNLWVLCDVHHRGSYMGIHAITRPHWDPQDLVFPKFWNRTPPPGQGPKPAKPKKPPTP